MGSSASASRRNLAYLLGPVLALALLPSNVVSAALPLLRAEWGTTAAGAGWIFAAYQAGYTLSVVVLLPLSDRVRSGRLIGGCAAASALAALLFPLLAHDLWSAVALRFLAGLGLPGIYMPGVRVVAAAVSRQRRGCAVGAYVSCFYLGTATSLWATGLLLPALGWRGAALVLGAISLAGVPLALLSTRDAPAPTGTRAHFDPNVLRHRRLISVILAYVGHSWELYVGRGWVAAFLAAALSARGLEAMAASAAGSQWAALMSVFSLLSVWLGGWLSDHVNRAKAGLAFVAASGACSLTFGFLGTGPWALLIAVGCLYHFVVSADSAIYSTAVTELAPPGRLGSAQAVQQFLGFSASAVAPVAAGLVFDLGGGWGGVFATAGVIGVLLALPLLPLARGK